MANVNIREEVADLEIGKLNVGVKVNVLSSYKKIFIVDIFSVIVLKRDFLVKDTNFITDIIYSSTEKIGLYYKV